VRPTSEFGLGPHAMSGLSPLSGEERKLVFGAVRSVETLSGYQSGQADDLRFCLIRPS